MKLTRAQIREMVRQRQQALDDQMRLAKDIRENKRGPYSKAREQYRSAYRLFFLLDTKLRAALTEDIREQTDQLVKRLARWYGLSEQTVRDELETWHEYNRG